MKDCCRQYMAFDGFADNGGEKWVCPKCGASGTLAKVAERHYSQLYLAFQWWGSQWQVWVAILLGCVFGFVIGYAEAIREIVR